MAIDIEELIDKARPRWTRLSALLDESESGVTLGIARLEELMLLYRQACTDLNLARSLTGNPLLLDRINQTVSRAYRFIYGGRRRTPIPAGALRRFFFEQVPRTFEKESRAVLAAALALLLGVAVGAAATIERPDASAGLIPAQFFSEPPRERVEHIESSRERIDSVGSAAAFGAFLYTHNIQVSFLCFALGALTIAGGLWLAFFNGISLGALAVRYVADGVGTFFVAWVGPHGALELPAIVFATAAGVRMGQALLLPGERGRKASLRDALPAIFRMLCTTAVMLVLAGIVEGSFSQLSSQSVPYALKIAVAGLLFTAMIAWLFGGVTRSRKRAER